jgi:hypothetical protein
MNVPSYNLLAQTLALLVSVACVPTAQLAGQDDWTWQYGSEEAPRWRIRGEYLLYRGTGNPVPPLVTTSPAGTPRPQAGVLGSPGVETLLGGQPIDAGMRSGGRFTIGRSLDAMSQSAVEISGLYVGDDHESGDFVRESPGSPILGRPFFNIDSGREDAELVAFPGVLAGSVAIDSTSDVYSLAALLRHNIGLGIYGRIDLVGGYRFFRLREDLVIHEDLESIDPGGLIPLGTTTDLTDRFKTGNDFHGGELGLAIEFYGEYLSLEFVGKVALGSTFRTATISGQTTTTTPGIAPMTTAGGLLALPTNTGTYSESAFSVLPEFALNVNIPLGPSSSVLFGYNLMFLNDVLRTGSQIDRVINTSQIGGDPLVGAARPRFEPQHSNFMLQGVTMGLEYRW